MKPIRFGVYEMYVLKIDDYEIKKSVMIEYNEPVGMEVNIFKNGKQIAADKRKKCYAQRISYFGKTFWPTEEEKKEAFNNVKKCLLNLKNEKYQLSLYEEVDDYAFDK